MNTQEDAAHVQGDRQENRTLAFTAVMLTVLERYFFIFNNEEHYGTRLLQQQNLSNPNNSGQA